MQKNILLKNINKSNFLNYILIFFISFVPIILLSGNAIINIFIIIIDIVFLIALSNYKDKKSFVKNNHLYILLFFFLSLILNLFFSINISNSFLRTIGFIKFILLVFAIKFAFEIIINNKQKKNILLLWQFIFFLVTFDVFFEYIFGKNIFGNYSSIPGRITSFLGQEYKIGGFYFGFILISLVTFFYNTKNNFFFFFLFGVFFFSAFIIGERSNFIKCLLIITIFVFLFSNKFFFRKVLLIFFLISTFFILIKFNERFKNRYYVLFLENVFKDGIIESLNTQQYGSHYHTAIKILKNNFYFGIGLKNFWEESSKIIYEDKNLMFSERRVSTHAHNTHFELLSETGIVGYICFLIFIILGLYLSIKNFLLRKNLYNLGGLLFIFVSLIPLIPSGSFFSTFNCTIFFINYAIMITNFDKNKT